MMWLLDGEKMKMCLLVSIEYTNVTDRRTPQDSIGRVAKISFSTNISLYFENYTRYGHSYNGRPIVSRV